MWPKKVLSQSEQSLQLDHNKVEEPLENNGTEERYRSYPQRWWLMISVALLNIANYSHWISFASVNSKAAVFYQTSTEDITRILTVSYGLGMPFCIIGTYIVSRFGLKTSLYTGGLLTFTGGLLCCLSTFPYLRDHFQPSVWYWTTLTGQALTGMGSPFIACVPTKISHHWFEEGQRIIATTILGLANPIGLVLGQAITPIFVQDSSMIPIMNIVWFVPALVGVLMVLTTVKHSYPPTPPSRSAQLVSQSSSRSSYLKSLLILVKNVPCLILTFTIGGAMGYVSALETVTEEIMCSLGYSNKFSGLCAAMVFIGGVFGSLVFGTLGRKAGKKIVYLVKITSLLMCGVLIGLIFIMQMKNQSALFVTAYTLLGFFAIGSYPVMLELAVEATYPVDESIVIALITMSSAVQGVIILELNSTFRKQSSLLDEAVTCHGGSNPMNHENYIYFLNGYGIVLSLIFLFFNPKFLRSAVNKVQTEEVISNKYTPNANDEIYM